MSNYSLPASTPGRSVLARFSERQIQTLEEIASGHIAYVDYPRAGKVYMGPSLVFEADDLMALEGAHFITTTNGPSLTPGGLEALVTWRDAMIGHRDDREVLDRWIRHARARAERTEQSNG
jgi:hypothetical protein